MKPNALRLLSLCTLIATWEIAGRTGNARLLPPVSKVMSAWLDLLLTGQLFATHGEIDLFGASPVENAKVLSRVCFIKESQREGTARARVVGFRGNLVRHLLH